MGKPGRPPSPPSLADRRKLLQLIRKHKGVVSDMARAVSPRITHQAMSQRLQRHGLSAEAAKARERYSLGGTREALGK